MKQILFFSSCLTGLKYSSSRVRSILFPLICITLLSSCGYSLSKSDFKKAQRAQEKGRYSEAVDSYRRIIRRHPEGELALQAAAGGAHVALFNTKDFVAAAEFYKFLVIHSNSETVRRQAQESLASIYHDKLMDYPAAIQEYNRLVVLKNDPQRMVDYRHNLAKAHFAINQFQDALAETDMALKSAEDTSRRYELMLLKGNILFNTKDVEQAVEVYKLAMEKDPVRAKNENILMNIIVCYEQMENFERAIYKLEEIRQDYEDKDFIDLKIKRLKERKANLPGSKGLRK